MFYAARDKKHVSDLATLSTNLGHHPKNPMGVCTSTRRVSDRHWCELHLEYVANNHLNLLVIQFAGFCQNFSCFVTYSSKHAYMLYKQTSIQVSL